MNQANLMEFQIWTSLFVAIESPVTLKPQINKLNAESCHGHSPKNRINPYLGTRLMIIHFQDKTALRLLHIYN